MTGQTYNKILSHLCLVFETKRYDVLHLPLPHTPSSPASVCRSLSFLFSVIWAHKSLKTVSYLLFCTPTIVMHRVSVYVSLMMTPTAALFSLLLGGQQRKRKFFMSFSCLSLLLNILCHFFFCDCQEYHLIPLKEEKSDHLLSRFFTPL